MSECCIGGLGSRTVQECDVGGTEWSPCARPECTPCRAQDATRAGTLAERREELDRVIGRPVCHTPDGTPLVLLDVAPCGVTVAAGTCDGLCVDCAEWLKACRAQRGSSASGVGLLPCPDKFRGKPSCVGCPELRAEVSRG